MWERRKAEERVGGVRVETNKVNSAASTLFTCLASFAGDYLLFCLSNDRPLTKRRRKVSDNWVGRNSMRQHTDQTPYCVLVLIAPLCKSPAENTPRNSHRATSLRDMLLKGQAAWPRKKKTICLHIEGKICRGVARECLLLTALTFNWDVRTVWKNLSTHSKLHV
jgi:hypothetical protein